jgi:hypothetical protein
MPKKPRKEKVLNTHTNRLHSEGLQKGCWRNEERAKTKKHKEKEKGMKSGMR